MSEDIKQKIRDIMKKYERELLEAGKYWYMNSDTNNKTEKGKK